jgi:7-carboxy-7-deazaguanine synthase
MTDLSLNSIYAATEGEGIHIGKPQIFVRFQGCAIGCLNCDSKETWDFDGAKTSLANAVDQVEEIAGNYPHRLKRISITGGDPLHPKLLPGVEAIAGELKKRGYYINVEASGSRVVDSLFDIVNFISFDFKTPSTGVKTSVKSLEKILKQYGDKAQIKSVVTDKKDFEYIYDVFNTLQEEYDFDLSTPWVVTPCYEPHEEFPRDRFIEVQNLNQSFGSPFRVIGQQHKWIHGPDKTLV